MTSFSTESHTDSHSLSHTLKIEAHRLGFNLVGIAPAVTPTGFHDLQKWLNNGYAGEMSYIPRREQAYEHPDHVLDGVKSVVMLAVNYNSRESRDESREPGGGRVSQYARGNADYHDVLKEKLKQLADVLHQHRSGCKTRGVVDTAPLLERDFAKRAGLGWFGKNTLLINKQIGSWVFLAALLTDVELECDEPHETSHCGTCTRCLDACPTDAFPEPYVLDARKCISYLNIELRESIPLELRDGMGNWLFGCDICQDVCPWNRKAPDTTEPAFLPAEDLTPADALAILQMDDEQFRDRFRPTPLWRPHRSGLLRNAAIVAGNSGDPRAVSVLVQVLNDAEPLIRGAVAWALGKLEGEEAATALQSRLQVEDNAQVKTEIQDALQRIEDK